MAFNQLTAAEAERLALLLEEMGEAQHVIGKILRHGYESYSPLDANEQTNRSLLEDEIGDVMHAIRRMADARDLDAESIESAETRKADRVEQYLHHQRKRKRQRQNQERP